MKIAEDWIDYEIIATGDGEKLERWGNYTLIRPDPQIIWHAKKPLREYPNIDAIYSRSKEGGGFWEYNRKMPDDFIISWNGLKFKLKLMGFKHTGLFPEQAVNWKRIQTLIKNSNKEISVLNLFGYTGAATVACLQAGASVTHVDSAKAMVDRCGDNVHLNGLENAKIRYIIDDCFKFCKRELKRGHKYDAIILDPPSFGRGPNGEKWKLEEGISELIDLVKDLLSEKPLFLCLNSYTTGIQPGVMANLLRIALGDNSIINSDEIGIQTNENNIVLPEGCTAFATFKG